MNTIPAFIDRSRLTISRAQRDNSDGIRQELTAVDPEGDTITLAKWTEDTGNTCVVPHSTLTVSYAQSGSAEKIEHKSINSDEAYDLASALKKAERSDEGVDNLAVTFLIADLRGRGDVGGAC